MGDIPIPRTGHRSEIIDERLYVFGGRCRGENGYLNDIHSFDLTSK